MEVVIYIGMAWETWHVHLGASVELLYPILRLLHALQYHFVSGSMEVILVIELYVFPPCYF
jgi:hypothetical protein